MKRETCYRMRTRDEVYASAGERSAQIVAVGDPDEWVRAGHHLPADSEIAFVAFSDIDAEMLMRLAPSVVLSPLLAKGFDCIDLAQSLVAAGFVGKYRAVTRRLPRPDLVVGEIRHFCPGLDFEILETD